MSAELVRIENALFVRDLHGEGPEREWFRLVDEHDVDAETSALAGRVRRLAALGCGIAPPRTLWFRELASSESAVADDTTWKAPPCRGWANVRAGIILVRADLPPAETAETVAHEVRHCGQSRVDEADAHWYGVRMRAAIADGRRVLSWAGFPYDFYTLAGEAECDDLLLAHDSTGAFLALYKNLGSKRRPRWLRISRKPRDARAEAAWKLDAGTLAALCS